VKYLPFILLLLLTCWSCNRTKEVIAPHTELIFPMEEGKSRILLVADTSFTTAGRNAPEVERYYKRERLGGEEVDLLGRPVRRLEVEVSPFDRGIDYAFQPFRLWTHYLEPQASGTYFAERVEENQRTLLLQFPVFPGVSWNGNLFNNERDLTFTYLTIDSTVTLQGQTYENCVVVEHENDSSAIRIAQVYEIYAPNIGRIKRVSRSERPPVAITT
jgi:hypothetical protein